MPIAWPIVRHIEFLCKTLFVSPLSCKSGTQL
jgi:hypothetical protein